MVLLPDFIGIKMDGVSYYLISLGLRWIGGFTT